MQTITLVRPWSYVTPLVTVDYGTGEHAVTNDIAAAALASGALGTKPDTPPGPLDLPIEELTTYIAGIDDLAVILALIKAEEAGKTRKGALDALTARKAAFEA